MSKNYFLDQMVEFASFTEREQRYIRSSIENAWRDDNDESIFQHWGKGISIKEAGIRAQKKLYDENLPSIIGNTPNTPYEFCDTFTAKLIRISIFDLTRGYIRCFSAYRFLYERLLTARVRPWLPSSFVAAATLPVIESKLRKVLLKSLTENAATAVGWSTQEPSFIPEWVDKVPSAK